jgi:hypothetical protein
LLELTWHREEKVSPVDFILSLPLIRGFGLSLKNAGKCDREKPQT